MFFVPTNKPFLRGLIAEIVVFRVDSVRDDFDVSGWGIGVVFQNVVTNAVRNSDNAFPLCHDRGISIDGVIPMNACY